MSLFEACKGNETVAKIDRGGVSLYLDGEAKQWAGSMYTHK